MPNMNDKSLVGGLTGTAISGAGAMISANEVYTWLSIGVTILGFIVTIITTIIIPLCQKKEVKSEDVTALKDELAKAKEELEELRKNG